MTPRYLCSFSAGLALFLGASILSCLSAQAQDTNAYSNRRGADMSGRNSLSGGVPSFQDTIEFLTEKAAEDERERATRENRFRTLPSYGSRQLDEYFKRLSPSLKYRQYGQ
ncbi:hypothetical protein [Nitrospira sp. Nam74]